MAGVSSSNSSADSATSLVRVSVRAHSGNGLFSHGDSTTRCGAGGVISPSSLTIRSLDNSSRFRQALVSASVALQILLTARSHSHTCHTLYGNSTIASSPPSSMAGYTYKKVEKSGDQQSLRGETRCRIRLHPASMHRGVCVCVCVAVFHSYDEMIDARSISS